MPATIVPINKTRIAAVKPAQGLRYGNFEGVRNLPPIRRSGTLDEQSLCSLNNEQIYRTVCHWMETWQPWQQRTLLFGIGNRCTVSQLEILSTTLEPLHHRDYKTLSLKRYPSAPFRGKKSGTGTRKKRSKKTGGRNIPVIVADDTSKVKDVKNSPETSQGLKSSGNPKTKATNNAQKDKDDDVSRTEVKTSTEAQAQVQDETVKNKTELDIIKPEGTNLIGLSEKEKSISLGVDQYASILSSSILLSALNDGAALSYYDKNQFSSKREESDVSNPKVTIVEPGEAFVKSQQNESQQHQKPVSRPTSKLLARELTLNRQDTVSVSENQWGTRSIGSGHPSRPLTHSSGTSSAKFLGGTLEFASDPFTFRRERSTSSRFRHSVFVSSVASTTDYFDKKKLAILGPMQHPMRPSSIQKPLHLESLPISLQKYHKNSRWWPAEPPPGRIYHQAKKQELATNFKEQLMTIWQWLNEWEGHERIAFLKEVLKICSADVLDAFCTHIQQRLKDVRDINQLPDKLLLYILSFLPPQDIFHCSQVCRRWRYLCGLNDLWVLKCLEVGEQEGISNMAELIQQTNQEGLSIDWMLAYTQLNKLIDSLRPPAVTEGEVQHKYESQGFQANDEKKTKARVWTGIIRPRAGDLTSQTQPSADVKKRHGKGSVRIKLNTGVQERLEQRNGARKSPSEKKTGTGTSGRGGTSGKGSRRSMDAGDHFDTDSAFSEKDLSSMLEEYHILRATDSPDRTVPQPRWSYTPRRHESNKVGVYDTLPEEGTPASSMSTRRQSSKASSSKRKEEESKEVALDIRTDLDQSHDLLGKMVSKTNLEWETADTYTDYMRTVLFAGDVVAVKRMRKVQGHTSAITCLQFDTRRLVTCGLDRVIRLWDVRSGRNLHKFLGHKGGIRCMQFDNDILATGSWDCLIMIWDMRQFTVRATLQGHSDSVTCLQFISDLLISGSEDRTVRLWRRPTFLCMLTVQFDAPVLSLIIIDHLFVVCTADLSIQMLDIYTGTRRRKFEPPLGPVHCLAIHGQLMLGGDSFGRVCFWNIETGEMEAAVKVHDAAVNKLCYLGGRFFTASSDSTIKEWDLMTMTCLRVLKGHKGPVRDVQVSQRRIVSCGDDSTTRIWDLVLDNSSLKAQEKS